MPGGGEGRVEPRPGRPLRGGAWAGAAGRVPAGGAASSAAPAASPLRPWRPVFVKLLHQALRSEPLRMKLTTTSIMP